MCDWCAVGECELCSGEESPITGEPCRCDHPSLSAELDQDQVCEQCDGSGLDGHDCGEDTCCCLRPEDNLPCQRCEGSGLMVLDRYE